MNNTHPKQQIILYCILLNQFFFYIYFMVYFMCWNYNNVVYLSMLIASFGFDWLVFDRYHFSDWLVFDRYHFSVNYLYISTYILFCYFFSFNFFECVYMYIYYIDIYMNIYIYIHIYMCLRVDLNPWKTNQRDLRFETWGSIFPILFLHRCKNRIRFVFRTYFGTVICVRAQGHCKSSRRSHRARSIWKLHVHAYDA